MKDGVIIYKNDLCSLMVDNENRLVCLDSDGEFIDYWSLNDESMTAADIIISVINDINGKNTTELCDLIIDCFDSVIGWCLHEKEDIEKIYEEYGREFVNRIGNAVLFIKE